MSEVFISKGKEESLNTVPGHKDGPLTRYVIAPPDQEKIIIHEFNQVNMPYIMSRDYCDMHSHEEKEQLILVGDIRMRLTIGKERDVVISSPCSLVIPSGVPHSINVISGTGSMLVIKTPLRITNMPSNAEEALIEIRHRAKQLTDILDNILGE
jgi:uncharacterized protein YjlB